MTNNNMNTNDANKVGGEKMTPLPCPFCGMVPTVLPFSAAQGDAWGEVRCENNKCVTLGIRVQDGVGIADGRGSDAYKQAAIKRWNNAIANKAEVDKLRRSLAWIKQRAGDVPNSEDVFNHIHTIWQIADLALLDNPDSSVEKDTASLANDPTRKAETVDLWKLEKQLEDKDDLISKLTLERKELDWQKGIVDTSDKMAYRRDASEVWYGGKRSSVEFEVIGTRPGSRTIWRSVITMGAVHWFGIGTSSELGAQAECEQLAAALRDKEEEIGGLKAFKEHVRQARREWAGDDLLHLDMRELLKHFRDIIDEQDASLANDPTHVSLMNSLQKMSVENEQLRKQVNEQAAMLAERENDPTRKALEEAANAWSFLSEFQVGTLQLDKSGDKTHGEHWCIQFYVGYVRTKYHGEGKTLADAITDAVSKWDSGNKAWKEHRAALAASKDPTCSADGLPQWKCPHCGESTGVHITWRSGQRTETCIQCKKEVPQALAAYERNGK